MCWWAGENLLDVAVYINDARSLTLTLLGGYTGAEVEGHDWEHILQLTNLSIHDHQIAWTVHAIGAVMMIGALSRRIERSKSFSWSSQSRRSSNKSGGRLRRCAIRSSAELVITPTTCGMRACFLTRFVAGISYSPSTDWTGVKAVVS